MNNERTDSAGQGVAGQPASPPSPTAAQANGPGADLRAECERLRQWVKDLQEERRQDRERLAAVEKERDEYRKALYAWAQQLFTDEELSRVPDEKDCLPLEEFLPGLERVVRRA